MYERTEQDKLADELLDKMVKKFKHSCKVFMSSHFSFYFYFKYIRPIIFISHGTLGLVKAGTETSEATTGGSSVCGTTCSIKSSTT